MSGKLMVPILAGVLLAVPAWATNGLRKADDLETKVRALLAERLQRIGYEGLLEAVMGACR